MKNILIIICGLIVLLTAVIPAKADINYNYTINDNFYGYSSGICLEKINNDIRIDIIVSSD